MLRKTPGLTAIAVCTLALGIGANTAIFSVVDTVLLRPLPYRDARTLVTFNNDFRGRRGGVSVPELDDYRDQAQVFDAISLVLTFDANVTGGDQPERVQSVGTYANYFEILGVAPLIGHTYSSADQRKGWTEVAVLSYGLWQRRFGGDPGILGKPIRIDDDPYTVIGVMPKGFRHPDSRMAAPADVWLPCGFAAEPFVGTLDRRARFLDGIGRLKPGVSIEQARAALATVQSRLRQQFPEAYPNGQEAWGVRLRPLDEQVVGETRPGLLVLLGAVVLVLLIACTNVANLLLARASVRQREMAIRKAVGASGPQLLRQLLIESVVLSLAGGLLGVVLAWWGIDLLVAFAPAGLPRVQEIHLDQRVLLFSLAVSIGCGLLFGVAPALQSSRISPQAAMQEGGAAVGDPRRHRLLSTLVIGEFALALVLLGGAGLLLRSLWNAGSVNPGFDARGVLTARLWLPQPNKLEQGRYFKPEQRHGFFDQLLSRLERAPGIEAAGVISQLPLRGDLTRSQVGFVIEGQQPAGSEQIQLAQIRQASAGYFNVLHIPLLAGRLFSPTDTLNAPRVVLINQALARRYWPGQDPIGKRIKFPNGPNAQVKDPWMRIVGVVADVKTAGLEAPTPDEIYTHYPQGVGLAMAIAVRGESPQALVTPLRQALHDIDPELPLFEMAPLEDWVVQAMATRRFTALLLAIFAATALLLAALGNYGVMAYIIGQRRREIGLRMALGAHETDVLRMVVGHGLRLAGVGLGMGAAGLLAGGRLLRSLLFGISSADPATMVVIAAVLMAVALLATWLPARRAARTSPMVALRRD